MLPHFHADDLVIVRKARSYREGDVVLYENRELHRPVLHRIVAVRGSRFVIKGDNNDFLDRPHALPGDVRGRLWLHVPGGGRWLRWLRVPLHASILAALVALLLVGGGGTGVVRRRERTPRPSPRALPPGRAASGALAARRPRRGPRGSPRRGRARVPGLQDAAATHRPAGEALRAERQARLRRLCAARGRVPGRAHRDGRRGFPQGRRSSPARARVPVHERGRARRDRPRRDDRDDSDGKRLEPVTRPRACAHVLGRHRDAHRDARPAPAHPGAPARRGSRDGHRRRGVHRRGPSRA